MFDYVVQKGTLTEDEASEIVRKVTSALVFMHSKHIGTCRLLLELASYPHTAELLV